MKKLNLLLFTLMLVFFNNLCLNADCNDVKVQANDVYEEIFRIHNDEELTVKAEIYNLTEEMYVVVLNDYNDKKEVYHYSDLVDGVLTIKTQDVNRTINYVVKIYSEDNTCSNEALSTIKFTTPKFNHFSLTDVCLNDYRLEMCDSFYDTKDMSFDEFKEKVDKIVKEKKELENRTFGYYFKKYFLFVLIPIILISAIYIIRIIIFKRGKKNA